MNNYAELLRHPKWQKKRLKIMERDEFKCHCCLSGETTLNVHHSFYLNNKMPWQYPDYALITLCETCHSLDHKHQKLAHLMVKYTKDSAFRSKVNSYYKTTK